MFSAAQVKYSISKDDSQWRGRRSDIHTHKIKRKQHQQCRVTPEKEWNWMVDLKYDMRPLLSSRHIHLFFVCMHTECLCILCFGSFVAVGLLFGRFVSSLNNLCRVAKNPTERKKEHPNSISFWETNKNSVLRSVFSSARVCSSDEIRTVREISVRCFSIPTNILFDSRVAHLIDRPIWFQCVAMAVVNRTDADVC